MQPWGKMLLRLGRRHRVYLSSSSRLPRLDFGSRLSLSSSASHLLLLVFCVAASTLVSSVDWYFRICVGVVVGEHRDRKEDRLSVAQ
eukprot:1392756-Amorphochlora_amoeboformis.AAC.2